MPSITTLTELAGSALKQLLTPIQGGFTLRAVRTPDGAEGLYFDVQLPTVGFTGLVPDGADEGTLSGAFFLKEEFPKVPFEETKTLCALLAEFGTPWIASGKPMLTVKSETPAKGGDADLVLYFCAQVINEVLSSIASFRALSYGISPELAANLLLPDE